MTKGPAEIAFGPMFIGTVLNIVLYGIMITQTFIYFSNYKGDRLWMKIFVGLLFLADTLNSVFDLIYLYDSLIIHFTDVAYLQRANWVFATDPAMTGIIAGSVQLFFAWRVKKLTRNIWMTAFIVIFAVVDILAGIGTAIAVTMIPDYIHFQRFEVIVIIWLVSAILADIAITSCLVWNLAKRKTGFSATDDVVNKIIRMTMQTGLVTSLFATADIVAFLADPTGTHLIFNMPLSKLYTNSLMSTLNARSGTKYMMSSNITTLGNVQSLDVSKLTSPGRAEVYVHVESHELVDKPSGLLPEPESNDRHDWDRKDKPADCKV